MNMPKYSDFGLVVKTKLLQIGKTQRWLAQAVAEKTGLFMDDSYINKIITGQRNAPKIVTAIREILDIKD